MTSPTIAELKQADCWFSVDRVANDRPTTDWKRTARLRQARWRVAHCLPIGSHPYAGGRDATPVGSRIALGHAEASGANFLSTGAREAATHRLGNPEPHQMLNGARLHADLLSSMPLCFNLFGAATDQQRQADAVRSWWPDAPVGRVTRRFEHSPGRTDPSFLGNKSAFDVAFEVAVAPASVAIIGVEVKYHEHARPESPPSSPALARYLEVAERSGAFAAGWQTAVIGSGLQQIWQDHLLLLCMLQHPSKRWTWGRFVLVYPAENPSFAAAAIAYRRVLADPSTFEARTLEELIQAPGALDPADARALADRYLGPENFP